MKWLTWENVGVDRIGCAWLIRRFIDADAEFLFIPSSQKSLPAGAEPFDIPGVKFSHHGRHCSFHAILKEHRLADPILAKIARIIDEADTIQEASLEPAAAGLDLICEGIRLVSPDDATAIERGAIVYNALYARLSHVSTAKDPPNRPI
jgi:hypothetical protein